MDFFERQEIARRNTRLLEVYFAFAVIGTVLAVYVASALFYTYEERKFHDTIELSDLWNSQLFLGVAIVTIFIIFCGSLYKISQLSGGGSVVAEMLGGRSIDSNTSDLNERKLLNVVEEMSIASGTPVPGIYLLPGEDLINAFAAGHSTQDMVICVTGGAVKYLTRDELQGVIGHEFSHILNGDMRLNLRLMGIVFGILCLAIIGNILLRTRGRNNPLPLLGLGLLVIGSVGVFFGKLIKSAVSRQREFLADAASVQFTRNPAGLANALKKVGGRGSRIDDANAEDASHFFFANGLTESMFEWMSTHPPLEERIRELDPAWDGKFTAIDAMRSEISEPDESPGQARSSPQFGNLLGAPILASGAAIPAAAIVSSQILPHIGAPTARHLDYAADIMSKLPEVLVTAAHDPMGAMALIYALLLSSDETIRNTELQELQADSAIYSEIVRLLPVTQTLDSRARLPLATLSITALRSLSPAQYGQFTKTLQSIITANGQTDLFAYVLQKIVLSRLDPNFNPPAKSVIQYRDIKPLLPDCAVLLSAIACAGQVEPADIERAFRQGVMQLDPAAADLPLDTTAYDLGKIDSALNRLNHAAPQIKKAVLNACAETVAADGIIQENEAELLRAIADTLDCPIPPFLVV
jgi:Zn-dependent protease with chaperone function/uncharacterized tellurite resistance protein B-like protein